MKTIIQIKSILGKLLFEFEKEDNSIKDTLIEAIKQKANLSMANLYEADLSRADLSGANLSMAKLSEADLSGANLSGAKLSGAYLYGANLYEADLSRANLFRANLSRADLYGAYLYGANLYEADLSRADLYGANLSMANLYEADLSRADLSGANLYWADLSGANLYEANFSGAKLSGAYLKKIYTLFQIVPSEGSFIAWKKGKENHLIKLEIPTEAKRHNYLGGRKCRAEFVKVLDIRNSKGHKVKECYNGTHNEKILYKVGEIVMPDSYDPSPLNECSNGIHFFLTKEEAKAWNL